MGVVERTVFAGSAFNVFVRLGSGLEIRASVPENAILGVGAGTEVELSWSPEDVIVVERGEDEGSTFHRLRREDLAEWLEEYTLGELWQKNVLGGRPQ